MDCLRSRDKSVYLNNVAERNEKAEIDRCIQLDSFLTCQKYAGEDPCRVRRLIEKPSSYAAPFRMALYN